MKKLFVFGFVAFLGAAALTSCKKDYKCTDPSDGSVIQTYSKLNKAEAETAETACKLSGGDWSKN